MDTQFAKDLLIPTLGLIGGAIGGVFAIYIYYRNSQLQRAQWLYSLFDKFYCGPSYAEIRVLLDYGTEEKIAHLHTALSSHSNIELEEKLVDYLNFFEFIASLWQTGQLPLNEIRMMFSYYIELIGKNEFIVKYLEDEGFEGLALLIPEVQWQAAER